MSIHTVRAVCVCFNQSWSVHCVSQAHSSQFYFIFMRVAVYTLHRWFRLLSSWFSWLTNTRVIEIGKLVISQILMVYSVTRWMLMTFSRLNTIHWPITNSRQCIMVVANWFSYLSRMWGEITFCEAQLLYFCVLLLMLCLFTWAARDMSADMWTAAEWYNPDLHDLRGWPKDRNYTSYTATTV